MEMKSIDPVTDKIDAYLLSSIIDKFTNPARLIVFKNNKKYTVTSSGVKTEPNRRKVGNKFIFIGHVIVENQVLDIKAVGCFGHYDIGLTGLRHKFPSTTTFFAYLDIIGINPHAVD